MAELLREIPSNPVPEGAIAGMLEAHDGKRVRFARFPATGRPLKGTVVLLHGRNEFIEKYFETIRDLSKRGFAVVTMDWRGQGGSDRLLRNPVRGHVGNFNNYARDLEQLFEEVVLPDCRGPFYVLAHSTGGLVALLSVPSMVNRVRRMVLVAPPLTLYGLPFSMKTLRRISAAFRWTGFGRAHLGGGSPPSGKEDLASSKLTSDQVRFARNLELYRAFPNLAVGRPTAGWLHAACVASDLVRVPEFMAGIRIPCLFIAAGADKVVSTPAIETYARGLRSGSVLTIDGARHEILQEADFYREQFWAAFDAFVPGTESE